MPPKKTQPTGRTPRLPDDLILEAAWLYYYEDRNQSEIAETLGVSRSSIVGYLQQARERGIVEVRLDPKSFARHRYARTLQERYGLADVQIAPGDTFSLERAALLAARCLPDLLEPGDTLGVAWGQTVFTLSEHVTRRAVPELTVVQMVGAVNSPYGFDSESCASRIAAAFGGRCVNLHVPAIVSSAAMAEALQRESVIAAQLCELDHINKALFAVGSCEIDSHIVTSGIAGPEDLADYQARGAVGLICSRFIDKAGNHLPGRLDERMIGLTPDKIRGLSTGILVSSGAEKIVGMAAALQGGYATHLFTDLPTAAGIVELGNAATG
ncbi:sugar-binding transcriptional regulator [Kaistia sp. UC242_56]|uniref:sugar-binding transcriptional regulator n=1 Tax=Kaistia sp. UC242_56 TaxID=3374625 RepID=UPI0037A9D46E